MAAFQGYGLFFAIFDVSRKAAIHTSHVVESIVSGRHWTLRSILDEEEFEHTKSNNRAPTSARVAQGTVLVTGGGMFLVARTSAWGYLLTLAVGSQ